MRVAVLANRASGTAGDGVEERLRTALDGTGADVRIECVDPAGLEAAARDAARACDRVVAAGGDGTVATVAASAAGGTASFAVLPLGTLNHFARDAGVPTDLAEAARVAVGPRTRRVDVGRANGRVFLNNLSIGAYAKAVRLRRRRRHQEPRTPKHLATARAAWDVLWSLPRHRIDLRIDGEPVRRVVSLLLVGNNRYGLGLGGLGARERLDEGTLCVLVVRATDAGAALRLALRAATGRLEASRDLEVITCRSLVIGAGQPGRSIRAAMDGEPVRLTTPIEVVVEPGALELAVP